MIIGSPSEKSSGTGGDAVVTASVVVVVSDRRVLVSTGCEPSSIVPHAVLIAARTRSSIVLRIDASNGRL